MEPASAAFPDLDLVIYSGRRFRHGTKLLRWRPDTAPWLCTFAQLEGGLDESLAAFWRRRAG